MGDDDHRQELIRQASAIKALVETTDSIGMQTVTIRTTPDTTRELYEALNSLMAGLAGFDKWGTPPSKQFISPRMKRARDALRLATE